MSLSITSWNRSLFCNYFFFSSRRRHTRLVSDWSSDVALPIYPEALDGYAVGLMKAGDLEHAEERLREALRVRSEERRVGKECRSRWSTEHKKKKKRKRIT